MENQSQPHLRWIAKTPNIAPLEEIRSGIEDFRRELCVMWPGCPVKEVITIEAKAHLLPLAMNDLHPLDQFERLQQLLSKAPGSLVVDLRLNRAEQMVSLLFRRVALALEPHRAALREQMRVVLAGRQGSAGADSALLAAGDAGGVG